jgi:hypothetical protein
MVQMYRWLIGPVLLYAGFVGSAETQLAIPEELSCDLDWKVDALR